LIKKRTEQERESAEWRRKAELAVQKGMDDLARAALERTLSHDQLAAGFAAQAEDQKHEADSLRQALRKLDQKLSETRAQCEMLVAEHRRARVVGRAARARQAVGPDQDHAIERMKSRVQIQSAENAATAEVRVPESLEERFKALESQDKVEILLHEMKDRHAQTQITDGSEA
jgi:phage shock protein A